MEERGKPCARAVKPGPHPVDGGGLETADFLAAQAARLAVDRERVVVVHAALLLPKLPERPATGTM